VCGEGQSSEYYSRREVRVYYNQFLLQSCPLVFLVSGLQTAAGDTAQSLVLVILPHHNGLMRFPSPFFVFFFVAVLHMGTKSVHYRFS
jgi:hypothetical protein